MKMIQTAVIAVPCVFIGSLDVHPLIVCILQALTFGCLYIGVNHVMDSRIQRDALAYFRGRL